MSYRYGPQLVTGAYHYGGGGQGVLGSDIPSTGLYGPSYLYNDLTLPADAGKEIRGLVTSPPSAGTWYAWEDGSFSLVGAPDGVYTFVYRLYVDGVDLGTATGSITIGSGLSGSATLDDVAASGTLSPSGASDLSGSATLGDISASGNLAPADASDLSGGAALSGITTSGHVTGGGAIPINPAASAVLRVNQRSRLWVVPNSQNTQ